MNNYTAISTMQPFKARDGRVIVPRPHRATFKGSHNLSKARLFVGLYYHQIVKHGKPLNYKELCSITGLSVCYVACRIRFFVEWEFMDRVKVGRCFVYTLAKRGKKFVEQRIPPDVFAQIVKDIKEYRLKSGNFA